MLERVLHAENRKLVEFRTEHRDLFVSDVQLLQGVNAKT